MNRSHQVGDWVTVIDPDNRSWFAQIGQVTDYRLRKSKSGRSTYSAYKVTDFSGNRSRWFSASNLIDAPNFNVADLITVSKPKTFGTIVKVPVDKLGRRSDGVYYQIGSYKEFVDPKDIKNWYKKADELTKARLSGEAHYLARDAIKESFPDISERSPEFYLLERSYLNE